ncbi:MAG: hypothetical protein V8S57_00425 [Oscillospiraceae bacterium]
MDESETSSPATLPEVTLNEADWFEKGGIYYYKMPVAPVGKSRTMTSNLLQANSPITEPTRQARGLPPRGDGAGREHSGRAEHGCGRRMGRSKS